MTAQQVEIPDGRPRALPVYVADPSGTPQYGLAVGAALAAYASNPAQTASAGADTLYKFGASGKTSFNHVAIGNFTGANIFYAFDQDSTASGNAIYRLADGQVAFWDRAGTVMHFSSAAQQSFGGQTGITVEAFA